MLMKEVAINESKPSKKQILVRLSLWIYTHNISLFVTTRIFRCINGMEKNSILNIISFRLSSRLFGG